MGGLGERIIQLIWATASPNAKVYPLYVLLKSISALKITTPW